MSAHADLFARWEPTGPSCDRFDAETLQAALHFSSGVNAVGEVGGMANNAMNIGITAGTVSADLRVALEQFAYAVNQRLFVDSGAFSEVAWSAELGRLVVVNPIDDDGWRARFELYRWAARTYGAKASVVAPDVVADQVATLLRLARWAAEVREVAQLGARVIVPVQKGELSMAEMWRRAVALLDLEDVIAGIPMKKDATSLQDLGRFAASMPARSRFHLLGLGPESRRFAGAIAAIRRACPGARITSDSATLRRLVGRANGPGDGPRIMTTLQDKARAENGGELANPQGVKDIAITWWRGTTCTIEDAFAARAAAGQLEVG